VENYKKNIGTFGELIAKNFLIRRGYKIISANHRIGRLEIDLITTYSDKLVFIEVKTRKATSAGPAQDALKSSQIKDLKRAISIYCRQRRVNINNIRLDLISIDLCPQKSSAKIQHFKDIF
jgi:putative endonuclease